MSLTLSEIRRILSAGDIQLTKSLGQNFLHDTHQLRRIATAGELTDADKVLEIGPGLGPLTEVLAETAGEILAIEKDARLLEPLRQRLAAKPNVTILHDDALDYLRRQPRNWHDWKLVANLPYSVASPILVELAWQAGRPERLVCTLQLEVARRLMALPDTDDYGILTLLLQLDYEPRGWFKIPASCFFPEPDVDSACIHLQRRTAPLLADHERETFKRLVKQGFSQRRKMMFKLLKQNWPADRLAAAFAAMQISPQIRAEHLSLEQFTGLARQLALPPAQTAEP